MDKFLMVIRSIDWVFASVILLGGRYWGAKYFRLSKVDALNFLGFATAFGIIWLAIQYFTVGIASTDVANLFITYLVTTSFYEVLAKKLFEWIEDKLPWFKKNETQQTVITVDKKGQVTDITEVKPDDKKE